MLNIFVYRNVAKTVFFSVCNIVKLFTLFTITRSLHNSLLSLVSPSIALYNCMECDLYCSTGNCIICQKTIEKETEKKIVYHSVFDYTYNFSAQKKIQSNTKHKTRKITYTLCQHMHWNSLEQIHTPIYIYAYIYVYPKREKKKLKWKPNRCYSL